MVANTPPDRVFDYPSQITQQSEHSPQGESRSTHQKEATNLRSGPHSGT